MKKLFFITFSLILIISSFACKKVVDKVKEDALVDYMVANKWTVQQYLSDTTNVTSEFNGYVFQFNRDNTVIGTNATISHTGTWNGDITAVTITAQFASGTAPLTRLNGKWSVASYDSNGPVFTQTISGVVVKLILRKK